MSKSNTQPNNLMKVCLVTSFAATMVAALALGFASEDARSSAVEGFLGVALFYFGLSFAYRGSSSEVAPLPHATRVRRPERAGTSL